MSNFRYNIVNMPSCEKLVWVVLYIVIVVSNGWKIFQPFELSTFLVHKASIL